MNEGWTTDRIVTVVLLTLVLCLGLMLLLSQNHQDQKIERQFTKLESLERKLDTLRTVEVKLAGLDNIVVRHEGQLTQAAPVIIQQGAATPMDAAPTDRPATSPTVSPAAVRRTAEGKDAIGRPLAATPGFSIYPPLDQEIPGRTVPRTPDFVPELCGMYLQGEIADPDKVNYYLTNDGRTQVINRLVHLRLFTINPDDPQELWPELAVAWETSDDRLTYRFHLRRGVVFSDGSPFTADDVVFSYHTIMDPNVESEHHRSSYVHVESVRKLDDLTVEVRMRRKYWKALNEFGYSLRPLSRTYHERRIPEVARQQSISPWSTVPGEPGFAACFNTLTRDMSPATGPYLWKEGESWVSNQHITLYPNPTCFLRALNPDHHRMERLRWRIIRDQVARLEEFKKGNLDVLVVDHNTWEDRFSQDEAFKAMANHYVYDHIGLMFSYLNFNCRRFPFNDLEVRRAVAHLVDRERILNELERGKGRIATCPTKPTYAEYSHDLVAHAFDPGRAAQILADAGWADTDGDGFLDKDGRTLEFTFKTPTGRHFFTTVTTWLQEACRRVGIRCKDDQKEWSLFIKDYYDRDFDVVCLYASAADPWINPYEEYHSSFVGPRQGNSAGWENREVDLLLERMQEEFDAGARAKLFHRFNHIFHAELPRLLLIHGEVGVMQNRRIQGAQVRPTGLQPFDMWIDPRDVRN